MPTYTPKASEIQHDWHVVDADGLILGRLCTEVARLLRGKHKPIFAPHLDTGDHVIIVNASKVVMSRDKAAHHMLYHHSGYPGGIKSESFAQLLARKPEDAVRRSVRGMLPKGPLGRQMLTKLKVYAGPDHPTCRPVADAVVDPGRGCSLSRSNVEVLIMATPLTQTTGRRKEAVARARLRPGTGQLTINGRAFEVYFPTASQRMAVSEPLRVADRLESFDIDASIHGGGVSGQAGALRMAIARSLVQTDPDVRPALKKAGLLTRDSRRKESKKYGLKKARKAPQFTKR